MLLAVRCPVCGARGPAPCATCRTRLRPAPALATPAGLVACHAVLAYEGAGRELVARLKYRNGRAAVASLAKRPRSDRLGLDTAAPPETIDRE